MWRTLLVLGLLLGVGACSDDDTSSPTTGTSFPGDPSLPDPGGAPAPITVAEALDVADGTEVRVAGHAIALPDGTTTLCGGPIMDSAPPQCGDPTLPVDGVIGGLEDFGAWSEGDVVVAGTVQGGRLVVP